MNSKERKEAYDNIEKALVPMSGQSQRLAARVALSNLRADEKRVVGEVPALARMREGQKTIPEDEMWRLRFDPPFSLPVGEVWVPMGVTIREAQG